MVILLISILLIIPLIGWMAAFVNCYSYYSQTDYNRIKFKSWTIISFLSMVAILVHLVIINCPNIEVRIMLEKAVGICNIMIYLFYSDFAFTTNYSLDQKNYKIKRYMDILCELFVMFILMFSITIDTVYLNAIALLIILVTSTRKRLMYCTYISMFYVIIEASKFYFDTPLYHVAIFSICSIGIVAVSLLRIDQIKKIEMHKMSMTHNQRKQLKEYHSL